MAKELSIEDTEVLGLINRGLLKFVNGKVLKWHNCQKKFLVLTPTQHKKSGRWRYEIWLGQRRRQVQRSKLHWMFTHRQIVPDGFDVDHFDHNNQNDCPSNLRFRNGPENWADNVGQSQLAEAINFFDEIARNNQDASF